MNEAIAPDTHALLWYLTEDTRLSAHAEEVMTRSDEANTEIVVSSIVLVEALRLIEKGKTAISVHELVGQLRARRNVRIRAVDMGIFQRMASLDASLEMHERIIVATTLEYGATVITKDREIAAAVETLW